MPHPLHFPGESVDSAGQRQVELSTLEPHLAPRQEGDQVAPPLKTQPVATVDIVRRNIKGAGPTPLLKQTGEVANRIADAVVQSDRKQSRRGLSFFAALHQIRQRNNLGRRQCVHQLRKTFGTDVVESENKASRKTP